MKNNISILPECKYQWNQNWANIYAHTDINLVISELKEIEDIYGKISPQFLVDSSKNKKSVLYDYFEWDNDKAANRWRLEQAKELLARIEVKVIKNGEVIPIRAYEINSRSSKNTDTQYTAIENISELQIYKIIKFLRTDLLRIKNRLSGFDGVGMSIFYIDEAIKELDKHAIVIKEDISLGKVCNGSVG